MSRQKKDARFKKTKLVCARWQRRKIMETFTCPRGHVLMPDQLNSTVDLMVDDIDKAVIFTCMTGDWAKDKGKNWHDFTLKRAIKSGMFTTEQVDKIRAQAKEHRNLQGYKRIKYKW